MEQNSEVLMNKSFLSVLACLMFCEGCVMGQRIPYAHAPIGGVIIENSKAYSLSISVVDKRPYVLSGKKDASFVGIFRAGFGDPWDAKTEGEIYLVEIIKRDLISDLQNAGFNIIENNAERQIIVIIHDYRFDCMSSCRILYRLDVKINDNTGNVIHTKIIDERKDTQTIRYSSAWDYMKKEMPTIHANIIRDIIRNDSNAMAVLGR